MVSLLLHETEAPRLSVNNKDYHTEWMGYNLFISHKKTDQGL